MQFEVLRHGMEESSGVDWLPLVISDCREDSGNQGRNAVQALSWMVVAYSLSLHSLKNSIIQDLVQKKVVYLIRDPLLKL